MAIGLDSVGYEEYFRRLFELLGVQLVQTTTNHHLDLDKTRLRKRKWRQRPEFKIEEAEKNIVKILAAKEQAKRDAIKGFTYTVVEWLVQKPRKKRQKTSCQQSQKRRLHQSAHSVSKRATKLWQRRVVFFRRRLVVQTTRKITRNVVLVSCRYKWY
jgi:hypothetical protein